MMEKQQEINLEDFNETTRNIREAIYTPGMVEAVQIADEAVNPLESMAALLRVRQALDGMSHGACLCALSSMLYFHVSEFPADLQIRQFGKALKYQYPEHLR